MTKVFWIRSWIIFSLALAFALSGCGDDDGNDDEEPIDGGDAGVAEVTATPQNGSSPLNVDFTCTATSAVAPLSFVWDFGDGTSSFIQNSSHTYVDVGEYTAFCSITDHDGHQYTGRVDVIVEDPNAALGPVIDKIIVDTGQGPSVPSNCAVIGQDTVQLTVLAHDQSGSSGVPSLGDSGLPSGADGGLDALIYQWVFESKPPRSFAYLNNANGVNPTFIPDIEGTYVIRVLVSDGQADALSMVSETVKVEAGIGNRLLPIGTTVLVSGQAGEIHPSQIAAEVQNACGAKAGNVQIRWTANNAVLPYPLPPNGDQSSEEEDELGLVQLLGMRSACAALPSTASITGIPYYENEADWYPEMEETTWTWNVTAGLAKQLEIELEREVPTVDVMGVPGQMDFRVAWSDGCGNIGANDDVAFFKADIVNGSSCLFSNGEISWSGNTAETTWPTIHCDQAGIISVALSEISNGASSGGECLISDLESGGWYADALFGPENYWTIGYVEALGPYSGSSAHWFDGEAVAAYTWSDWHYLYTPISYSDANCGTHSSYPHPYTLKWHQAFNFASITGGYVMASSLAPPSSEFDVTDEENNWWAAEINPSYTGTISGFAAWTGTSRWAPAQLDITRPLSNWACANSGGSLNFYWLYAVPENTALTQNYWMIDDVELWGWCTAQADSEFTAGLYFEAQITNTTNGVLGCEIQPATVTIQGYDQNYNPTPGAQVVVNYVGPALTTLQQVDRGLFISSGQDTATIELGPQGDAVLYFNGAAAGSINVTIVPSFSGTAATASIELYNLALVEADAAVCDNDMDDDCDCRIDCADDSCADAAPCLADLVPYAPNITYDSYTDTLSWSYYLENAGNDLAGSCDSAIYLMEQDAVPSGTPLWTYSDWSGGELHPPLDIWEIFPTTGPISDYYYPYSEGLAPGNYSAYLFIDHTNLVDEADETNNLLQYDFTVVGPNLAEYTGATHTAIYNASSGLIDFYFYYMNDGALPISLSGTSCADITAYLMADGIVPDATGSNALRTAELPDAVCVLSSSSWTSSTAYFDPTGTSPLVTDTPYDLYFRLDSTDALVESSETDNLVGPVDYTYVNPGF